MRPGTYRHSFNLGRSLVRLSLILAGLLLQPLPVLAQDDVEDVQEEAVAPEEEEEAEKELEAAEKSGSTEINVKNADIAAVVRIFSRKTKRNYILDERVKGKVSIYLPGKISSDEAIRILDSVLQLKGFTAVPIGDNLWKIIPSREARQTTIPTITSEELDSDHLESRGSPSMVTRLIHLKFVGSDEIKQLLTPLVSSEGLINAYTGTNALIIIDAEENIHRLEAIINSLDIPYSDQEMAIVPVNHAEATDIAEKVNQILGEEESQDDASAAGNQGRLRLPGAMRTSAPGQPPDPEARGIDSVTVAGRVKASKIIADERTNSLIVVADPNRLARIRALVSELDSPVDLSGNRFYVYRCQNADAESLAEVLAGLVGQGTTGTGSRETTGLSTADRSQEQSQRRLDRQRRTPGQSRTTPDTATGPTTVNFGEEISITADPSTNSLVINSSKTDYMKIRGLLEQLDVKRRQVLVEALVLEVDITDQTDTSFEFLASGGGEDGGVFAANNLGNLASLLSNPTQLSNFSVAAASAGSLTLPGDITIPTQTVLLRAARNNGHVNVMSAPNILATDNEEAEIVVGQNVPFIASTSTSQDNLNNTFNQIDRQDVGITLRITPQISSNDFVTLRMFTEVSDLVPGTTGSDLGPTTTVRTSETTVITKNGQMIVIGGLMADNIQSSESGIPFLKEIPVLGNIFKSTTDIERRTNLLIFITPRIVSDQFDARDTTIEQREEFADELGKFDVMPERRDILENDKVHDVILSHLEDFDGTAPTTIRPGSTGAGKVSAGLAAVPVTVKAAPQLPSEKSQTQVTVSVPGAPTGALRKTRRETGLNGFSHPYVILQIVEPDNLPASLPFRARDGKFVAVELPAGGHSAAEDFFKAGRTYRYNAGSSTVRLRVLGRFASTTEAEEYYDLDGGEWHVLSPYEIMNLGKAPWIKENN